MIRRICVVIAVLTVSAAASLSAQQGQGTVGQLYRLEATPGDNARLEEGMKRHIAFHKEKGDPWEWHAWSLLAGPYTGQYWAFTGNHNWSDFDNDPIPEGEDAADNQATMGPWVGSQTMELLDFQPELSVVESEPEYNLLTVMEFRLSPGGQFAFMEGLRKITEALRAADKGFYHGTYLMVAGANSPKFYVSFPRDNWADFASRDAEFEQAMVAAHGEEGFSRIMNSMMGAVRRTDIHVARFLPEMSLLPGGN